MFNVLALWRKINKMRSSESNNLFGLMRNFAVSCILLALVACSSGFHIGAFESIPGPDSGFYPHLAQEYHNIADYEADEAGNDDVAAYFRLRAEKARREIRVYPENPAQQAIPEFERAELVRAYDILRDGMHNMYSPNNEPLLALAQAKYDCWVAHRKQFPQEKAVLACKDDFYAAIAELSPPEIGDGLFSVFFDSGGVVLDERAMETVRKAADYSREHPGWDITLYSFTDSVGSRAANEALSMRRAIAVRNALVQQGVRYERITIQPQGQREAEKRRGDQVDDENLRRVEINFRPAYGRQNDGGSAPRGAGDWDHAGN